MNEKQRAINYDDGATVMNVEQTDAYVVTHLDDPGVVAVVTVLFGGVMTLVGHEIDRDHVFESTLVLPRDPRTLDDLQAEARQMVGQRVEVRRSNREFEVKS